MPSPDGSRFGDLPVDSVMPIIISRSSTIHIMSSIPRFQILFHPQLRTSLPRTVQRDLRSRLFTRLKTQNAFRAAPETNARNAPAQHAKTTIRRGTRNLLIPQYVSDGVWYRATGAHIDLQWWNGQDDVPEHVASHDGLLVRSKLRSRCARV